MKRFYKLVSTAQEKGGYSILLDGRAVKTRSGRVLLAAGEELAGLVMREWAEQGKEIVPDTMPLTQILNTKIDRVADERAAISAAVLKYLDTDLLCYFAGEPPDLAAMQRECRTPWLEWFAAEYGAALETTEALCSLRQNSPLHDKVAARAAAMSDDVFTVFQLVTALCGSIVLALAFCAGAASPEDVMRAAFVEEDYKDTLYHADLHGPDPMQEKKRQAMRRDLEACAVFLKPV